VKKADMDAVKVVTLRTNYLKRIKVNYRNGFLSVLIARPPQSNSSFRVWIV
jgi:hypothetical protein